MAADIHQFDTFALSSRGILARLLLPNNRIAYRADIAAIDYEVKNITDDLAVATGSLVVADVMYTTLQLPWRPDKTGWTFCWPFDGNLLALASRKYRFVVTFTIANTVPEEALRGKSFRLVWQANVKDPLA